MIADKTSLEQVTTKEVNSAQFIFFGVSKLLLLSNNAIFLKGGGGLQCSFKGVVRFTFLGQ